MQAYLAGLTFALAASPCSTPVLATLLGYVAASRVFLESSTNFFRSLNHTLFKNFEYNSDHVQWCLDFSKRIVVLILIQDPIIGGSLLLTYTTGYVTPLLLAASFAGALQVRHYLLSLVILLACFQPTWNVIGDDAFLLACSWSIFINCHISMDTPEMNLWS